MELYEEILFKMLKEEDATLLFPNCNLPTKEIVEMKCYKVLQKIKAILEDNSLEDPECFMKIEQIVCLFEQFGSDCGDRHDF